MMFKDCWMQHLRHTFAQSALVIDSQRERPVLGGRSIADGGSESLAVVLQLARTGRSGWLYEVVIAGSGEHQA